MKHWFLAFSCAAAFFVSSTSFAEETRVFAISPESSTLTCRFCADGFLDESYPVHGVFRLIVNESTETYRFPTAKMISLSVGVNVELDRPFDFPEYLLKFTPLDDGAFQIWGDGDGCNDFHWRHERHGSCWSTPSTSEVSGTAGDGLLYLEGEQGWLNPYSFELEAVEINSTYAAGDFNNDGFVDAADYTIWRNAAHYSYSDDGWLYYAGLPDGRVNEGDYQIWRDHYGAVSEPAEIRPTPEPTGFVLALFVGLGSQVPILRAKMP